MSTEKKQLVHVVVLMCCVACLSLVAFSQSSRTSNLKRDQAVVRRDKPSVYICLDRKTESEAWLRIHNNTVWTLQFQGGGRSSKLLTLSNGKRVAALSSGSLAFPEYRFESKSGGEVNYAWEDVHTVMFLPSGAYALFKVPANKFDSGLLFLQYVYEWELTGAVGSESNPPQHRVFNSGNKCDW